MSKVSIIIPCYNKELYVSEAIESALAQTFKDIEIVVINDGSSDNSAEVIKKYEDKIHFINLYENEGVIKARNLAIEKASGEYILPLDADDTIEPTYVEKAVKILDEDKDVDFVYSKVRFFGKINREYSLGKYSLDNFIFKNCICNSALFKKADFISVGKYKDYMKDGYEDWDLWMSFIEKDLKPFKIEEVLLNYRQVEDNSRNKHCKNNLDLHRELIKHHLDLYLNNNKFLEKLFKKPKNPFLKLENNISDLTRVIWVLLIFEIVQIVMFGLYIFMTKGL